MIHFLITVHDDCGEGEQEVLAQVIPPALAGALAPFDFEVRPLPESQRGVIKSALRYYGRKQDKNREDLIRKGRPTAEVDHRIESIDAAYEVVGWDVTDDEVGQA